MKKMLVFIIMIALGFLLALTAFDNNAAQSTESDNVKTQIEQLKTALEKLENERDNLKEKLAVSLQKREQLQEKTDELTHSQEKLRRQIEKYTFTFDQSRQQLTEIIGTRDKLKKQVSELSNSRDNLRKQYEKLAASHNQLGIQVGELTELRDQAVAKAQTAQKRIEILVAMLESERQESRKQQDRLTVTNQVHNDKQPAVIEISKHQTALTDVSHPTVVPKQVVGRPICHSFNTARPWIMPGQTSILSWQVANADQIYIEPDIGPVSALGSRAIDPSKTTTYTLTAVNREGKIRQTCRIEVGKSLTISSDRILPQVSLKPDPTSGENIVLSGQESSINHTDTNLEKFLGYRARKDESGKFVFIPVFENQQEE